MKEQSHCSAPVEALEPTAFDYDNADWPRDFDIRVEKAEQREVLETA